MGDSAHVMAGLVVVAAAGTLLLAVVSAVLAVATAEYLFEVGYRLVVRRTGLMAALRLEGPLRGMWSPVVEAVFRKGRRAGPHPTRRSGPTGS